MAVRMNMAGYLSSITKDMELAISDISEKITEIHSQKEYGEAAGACEYARGIYNSVICVLNNMSDGYASDMLNDMVDYWSEQIDTYVEIMKVLKKEYWKGGDDDGRTEDITCGTDKACEADSGTSGQDGTDHQPAV